MSRTSRRAAPTQHTQPDVPGVEAFTPIQLHRVTHLFASDADLIGSLSEDPQRPGERSWRTLVDSPKLQVWLIRWPVGTSTGWHDHGGALGAFTVIQGELSEQTRPHSLLTTSLPLGEGRAFGSAYVHNVVNDSDDVALSVHAYSPSLAQMTHFDLVDGVLVAAGVEQRPAW